MRLPGIECARARARHDFRCAVEPTTARNQARPGSQLGDAFPAEINDRSVGPSLPFFPLLPPGSRFFAFSRPAVVHGSRARARALIARMSDVISRPRAMAIVIIMPCTRPKTNFVIRSVGHGGGNCYRGDRKYVLTFWRRYACCLMRCTEFRVNYSRARPASDKYN